MAGKTSDVTIVEFTTPEIITVEAKAGDELGDIAKAAGVEIKYKCRKGECGTCEVKTDGKWIKTCQTTIPFLGQDEVFRVEVKAAESEKAAFFSPKSLADGFFNNVAGMAGFAQAVAGADEDYNARIAREQVLAEKVEAAKKKREG